MRETSEEIREHRQNLIRAESADPNPEFGPLLDKSNADDLQWLLGRLFILGELAVLRLCGGGRLLRLVGDFLHER